MATPVPQRRKKIRLMLYLSATQHALVHVTFLDRRSWFALGQKRPWRYVAPTTEMQAKTNLKGIIRQAGVAMWSRLLAVALACALLLLPARAEAGVKEEVAALAPSGLVLVMDAKGNELVAQNADEPFVPASVTKIVTAWLAMEVLGGDYRFQTRFYLDDDRVLYVRGGGDPHLISEESESPGRFAEPKGSHDLGSLERGCSFARLIRAASSPHSMSLSLPFSGTRRISSMSSRMHSAASRQGSSWSPSGGIHSCHWARSNHRICVVVSPSKLTSRQEVRKRTSTASR